MKTELLAEKTALVMQNKNGGFRDLYGSLSTVHYFPPNLYVKCTEFTLKLSRLMSGLKRSSSNIHSRSVLQSFAQC